jgi:polar amino acid transport system substrate-binding protein
MRKALIACLALAAAGALVVVAAATGARTTSAAPAALVGCAKSSLNLIEDGKLTIGTDNPAFPPWWGGTAKDPWETSDPRSGKGYESAVAYAIARKLGFTRGEVEWVPVPFNNSFKPGKKDFDFYVAQVSYKPERAKNVAFSAPYYFVQQAVVAIKGTPISKVRSIAGLRQYKLGVAIGTTSYDTIVNQIKPDDDPAVFDTNNDAVTALKNKQIDGLVVDYPSTGYITGVQVPTATVVGRFESSTGKPEYFGAIFAKGNSLVGCVNKAIRQLRAEGKLRLYERIWLGQAGAPILK